MLNAATQKPPLEPRAARAQMRRTPRAPARSSKTTRKSASASDGGGASGSSSTETKQPSPKKPKDTEEKLSAVAQLRAYGLAGVASYGLWNTIYYLLAFSAAWMAMSGSVQGQVRGEAKGTRGAAARHTRSVLLLPRTPTDPSPSLTPDIDPTSTPSLTTHSRDT